MYRQGDVLLIPVKDLPEGLEKSRTDRGFNVLAYGEVTGHAHAVKAEESELYVANDNLRIHAVEYGVREPSSVTGALRVMNDDTPVWHGTPRHDRQEPGDPDHDAISLPAGDYLVILPREYRGENEFVRVAD